MRDGSGDGCDERKVWPLFIPDEHGGLIVLRLFEAGRRERRVSAGAIFLRWLLLGRSTRPTSDTTR